MGILIDSSVLIACERRRMELDRLFAQHADDTLAISPIVVSELLHGVYRATSEEVRSRRLQFIENVVAHIPVLDIQLDTAHVHARLWADLRSRGVMVGAHDAWLAATALQHDLTVATLNTAEFRQVPGLRVEPWELSE